jgi:hypothetical protein
MRILFPSVLIVILLCSAGAAFGASAQVIDVLSIAIDPQVPEVGKEIKITARIARSRSRQPQEPMVINVIGVVTLPDNVTKSSTWKKETFERRQAKEYVLAKLFDAKRPGQYKVEFNVYSADMRRRLARSVKSFTVAAKAPEAPGRRTREAEKTEAPRAPERERNILGIGVYGNALNPSGGGTLLLWPHDHVGLQGSYTAGTFTLIEARLLVRLGKQGGIRPYVGVGYIDVTRETEVIGVTTEFKDSGVSGVVGVEIPFGRRLIGYAEVSGSAIELEKVVTNGAQTVTATVDYTPVTIGAGIVLYLF